MRVYIRLVAVGDEGQQREKFRLPTVTHGYIRHHRDALVQQAGRLLKGHPLAGRLAPTAEGDNGVAYMVAASLLTASVVKELEEIFHDALAYVERHGLEGAP